MPFTKKVVIGALALCAGLANAQYPCGASLQETTTTVTTPGCTWTWLMSYPTMTGATTTVYSSVVTLDYDAIDCNVCSVTNIPFIPSKLVRDPDSVHNCTHTDLTQAIWTSTVTAATPLTLSSMGCLALPTSSVTPSDIFGGPTPTLSTASSNATAPVKGQLSNLLRRQAPATYTPLPTLTPQQAAALGEQIALAVVIVNQISSGQNIATLCSSAVDPAVLLGPSAANINATFVQEVVCSLSNVEKGSVVSTVDQLADIAAAFGVIDAAASIVNTTDPAVLCQVIDFPSLAMYNIDWQALQSLICNAASSLPSASTTSSTVIATPPPATSPYIPPPPPPPSPMTSAQTTTSQMVPPAAPSPPPAPAAESPSTSSLPSSLSFDTGFPGATVGPVPLSSPSPVSGTSSTISPSSPLYPFPSNSTLASGASGMSASGMQMSTGLLGSPSGSSGSSFGTAPPASMTTLPYSMSASAVITYPAPMPPVGTGNGGPGPVAPMGTGDSGATGPNVATPYSTGGLYYRMPPKPKRRSKVYVVG